MSRLIGLAAALLPPYIRERYREQWLADLRDVKEAGIRGSEIVVGAFVFGATINRAAPEISGVPLETFALRKARWGVGFLASAVILAFSFYTHAGTFFANHWDSSGVLLVLLNGLSLSIAIGMLVAFVAGIAHLVSALVRSRNRLAQLSLLLLLAGAASIAGFLGASDFSFVLLGAVLFFASGIVAIIVLTNIRPTAKPARPPGNRRRSGILGTIALLMLVALGTVDLLVWNPLAMVPGRSLDEIYAGIGAGLTGDLVFIIVWTVFWGVLAFAPIVLTRLRFARFGARAIMVATLVLGGSAIFFKFWAGFGIGMDIADGFAVSGGNASIAAGLLDLVGTLALVAAVLLTVPPRRLLSAEWALA
jgi:hypothetical protein